MPSTALPLGGDEATEWAHRHNLQAAADSVTDWGASRAGSVPNGSDRFSSLTDLLRYSFLEFDRGGRVLYFNAATSTAFPNETTIGQAHPLLANVAPGEWSSGRQFVRRTIEVDSRQFDWADRSGDRAYVSTATPARPARGAA